jgi:hypothetical protein
VDYSHLQGARKRQADHGDGADEHAGCDEPAFAIAHCITKARRWTASRPKGEVLFYPIGKIGTSERANSRIPKFHYITFPPRYGSALRGYHTHGAHGEAAMSVVLNDLLLFSCLTALVTGIVIAVATLLI